VNTEPNRSWRGAFLLAFAVLTLMTWSPLGYGSYGPASRILGIPDWTVVALLAGALLFVLQWIFLFHSGLALGDEELPGILQRLKEEQQEREQPPCDPPAERKVVNA
jgi:hypothetical protein